MNDIITVSSLKKSFGKVKAVKGIDFAVKEGTLFAFLGPNGAGKSTTIDILCTLSRYDEGKVTVAGCDLDAQSEQIRSSIGVVFQDNLMDKRLTVRENLLIRAGFYHKTAAARKEAVQKAAVYAEITEFMNRTYGTLSGGQRRRADIARALLNTPRILFLDEPTTGLDPQTRKHIWETVERLQKENNMTIFLTTHYMEEAAKADYVVIMDDGLIVAQGTPYELKEKYSFEHVCIKPKAQMQAPLQAYLDEKKLSYTVRADFVDVKIKSTLDALDLLAPVKDLVESFEVLYGTMDDVFLNITGKELRE
ncbi:MAG: ATP-binding cassette domain-containing protein [Clostridia bacterium]|nr:ATP-binding cassette domain-containing protein [Clostridia bacterium]